MKKQNKNLYHEYFNVTPIKEADLVNKISEYKGGVAYKLHDPATAQNVNADILKFAAKNHMQVIKQKSDQSNQYHFIHFRLGDDPGKESQKIQGFVSQLPEVSKFKFTTLDGNQPPAEQPAPAPAPAPTQAPAPAPAPQRN